MHACTILYTAHTLAAAQCHLNPMPSPRPFAVFRRWARAVQPHISTEHNEVRKGRFRFVNVCSSILPARPLHPSATNHGLFARDSSPRHDAPCAANRHWRNTCNWRPNRSRQTVAARHGGWLSMSRTGCACCKHYWLSRAPSNGSRRWACRGRLCVWRRHMSVRVMWCWKHYWVSCAHSVDPRRRAYEAGREFITIGVGASSRKSSDASSTAEFQVPSPSTTAIGTPNACLAFVAFCTGAPLCVSLAMRDPWLCALDLFGAMPNPCSTSLCLI